MFIFQAFLVFFCQYNSHHSSVQADIMLNNKKCVLKTISKLLYYEENDFQCQILYNISHKKGYANEKIFHLIEISWKSMWQRRRRHAKTQTPQPFNASTNGKDNYIRNFVIIRIASPFEKLSITMLFLIKMWNYGN